MEKKCSQCKKLERIEISNYPPPGRVENLGYHCTVGKFDRIKRGDGTMVPQYYSWGGIVNPNKTVATAQKDCAEWEEGKPR